MKAKTKKKQSAVWFIPVETVITLGRKPFTNTKTLLLHFGIGRHFMVSCKISLQSESSVTASASQLAVDSIAAWIYSSLHQKNPSSYQDTTSILDLT